MLEIRLLGGLVVRVQGRAVADLGDARLRSLLAFLAVEGHQGQPYPELASRLWPAASELEGRNNLRGALEELTRILGPAANCLVIDSQQVALPSAGADRYVDTRHLEEAAAWLAEGHDLGRHRDWLWQGLEAYQGPLLAGVELVDLQDWRQAVGERLARQARDLAQALTRAEEAAGRPQAAIAAARRWVELAASEEAGHFQLVRLLAERGEHQAARAQFANAVQALAPDGAIGGVSRRLEGLGRELEETAATDTNGSASAPAPLGERRAAQVLYAWPAAPAGSRQQPEEREALLQQLATALQGRGGYVVPDPGGGLLAYFGYPVAREDGARQAVDAGRELVADPVAAKYALRVGIEAGPILTRPENPYPDVSGSTTRRAVELARQARPGEVVVGEGLRERLGAAFAWESVPQAGLEEGAAEAFRVAGEGRGVSPGHATLGIGGREMVGRETELARLLEHWRAVGEGQGRLVGLTGEAGLGKTRLIQALRETVVEAGGVVREARCQPEAGSQPYLPVAGLVREVLGVAADAPRDFQHQRIHEHVADRPRLPEGAEEALALLLGLRAPDLEADALPPEVQRRRLESVLVGLLEDLAATGPVLLVLEDVHWSDPSTRKLLENVRDRLHTLRVLLLVSTRQSSDLPPGMADNLELAPLSNQAARRIARNTTPAELTPGELWQVVERAGGVPMFVEELVRVVAGEGASEGGVPSTLRDLLLAQLDGLGAARPTAQAGALVGHQVPMRLLARVLPERGGQIEADVDALVAGGILEPCPETGEGCYRFRHALLREAAEGSVTDDQRRLWHARIAEAQLEPDSDLNEGDLAQAAEHLAAGGYPDQAVDRFQQAAEQARLEAALGEAERLFERGLAELARTAAGPSRDSREADLRIGLGTVQMARLGYGAREVDASFHRALELVVPAERSERVFRALWGLWLGASSRSGYEEAQKLAKRMRSLAEDLGDECLRLGAHSALGNTLLWLGELETARQEQYTAHELCADVTPARLIAQFGEDPRATNLAFMSWSEWLLGREAEAHRAMEAAREVAGRGGHPHTWAYVRTFEAMLAFFRQDPAAGLSPAAEVQALAEREGMALWQAAGSALLGWARAGTGDPGGVDQVRRTLACMRQAMEGVGTAFLMLLAWSQLSLGLGDDALATLAEVDDAMASTGDSFLSPEAERLRGEAYWQRGEPEYARRYWQAAQERAQQLGSPVLEARATARLSTRSPNTV